MCLNVYPIQPLDYCKSNRIFGMLMFIIRLSLCIFLISHHNSSPVIFVKFREEVKYLSNCLFYGRTLKVKLLSAQFYIKIKFLQSCFYLLKKWHRDFNAELTNGYLKRRVGSWTVKPTFKYIFVWSNIKNNPRRGRLVPFLLSPSFTLGMRRLVASRPKDDMG